ncbi:hypothetical protein RF11_07519 [Thelohanellus kitauei]|uniref:Tc1-like transposase DDE domain-containing protein n=1 Tax=Thelohanellus kitauei TaxID=669202 RepID=A0A0C2IXL2_THEKT|nr:hypothetical protein RF11_07519 [Thelohanellus kitauei]
MRRAISRLNKYHKLTFLVISNNQLASMNCLSLFYLIDEKFFSLMTDENLSNRDRMMMTKTDKVRNAITAFGYSSIFLPPYSPFLNQSENLFSKWMLVIRRGNSGNAELLEPISRVSISITSSDCMAFNKKWSHIYHNASQKYLLKLSLHFKFYVLRTS